MHAEFNADTSVDPAEIAKFEALAQRWWDPTGEFRPLHELNPVRLAFIEKHAPLEGKAVLDVGCGGGILAEAMARRGANVLGIDLAAAALQVAELHAAESLHAAENSAENPNGAASVSGFKSSLEYRLQSAEELAKASPAGFDVVTCMEMLEHVPDPAQVVTALARLVKPGGRIYVSTLNRTPKAFLMAIVGAEYVMRMLPKGTHEYERFIRPSELAGWARAVGLDLRELAGIEYNLLSRRFALGRSVDVNYLAYFTLPPRS